MSVLKQKRHESQLQFIETARQLEIYTLRNCVKFPKRYTFLITTEIVRLAHSIYNGVKAANSVFPSNEMEFNLRREYLTKANCDLQCLISQLDIAKELFGSEIKAGTWCGWMDLIEAEAKYIASIKKRDKEHFKAKMAGDKPEQDAE